MTDQPTSQGPAASRRAGSRRQRRSAAARRRAMAVTCLAVLSLSAVVLAVAAVTSSGFGLWSTSETRSQALVGGTVEVSLPAVGSTATVSGLSPLVPKSAYATLTNGGSVAINSARFTVDQATGGLAQSPLAAYVDVALDYCAGTWNAGTSSCTAWVSIGSGTLASIAADGLTVVAPVAAGLGNVVRFNYSMPLDTPDSLASASAALVWTVQVDTSTTPGGSWGDQATLAHALSTAAPTAPGPPGRPTCTATATDAAVGSLSCTWTSGYSGGSAVTGYDYSTDGGSTWATLTGTGLTRSFASQSDGQPLANGYSYGQIRVRAVNAIGAGEQSLTASATTYGLPEQPQLLIAAAGDEQVALNWSAPATYLYLPGVADNWASTPDSTALDASNLDLRVKAALADWTPQADQVLLSKRSGAEASATSWSLLVKSDGTLALVLSDGSTLTTLTSTAATGITDGQARWVRAVRIGTAVTFSTSIDGSAWTPLGDALTGPSAALANTSAPVAIGAQYGGTGGALAAKVYRATIRNADDNTTLADFNPSVQRTTPSIAQVSFNGAGTPVESWTVRPASSGTLRARILSATGGSPLTSHSVTASPAPNSPGVSPQSTGSAGSTFLRANLTNGTAYTFTVAALNAQGASSASASASATPFRSPTAATIVSVTPSDATLSVAFAAPTDNGGQSIVGYDYSTDNGATWYARTDGATTTSPLVITKLSSDGTTALTNGTTYSIRIRANNTQTGTPSNRVDEYPNAPPGAPTLTAVTNDTLGSFTDAGGRLSVAWTPGTTGGDPVSSYDYSTDNGATWAALAGTKSPQVISKLSSNTSTGLTNGTSYAVMLRARNRSATASAASSAITAAPYTYPSAPRTLAATRSASGSLALSWLAPTANGGFGLVAYTATATATGQTTVTCQATATPPAAPATGCTLSGLTNGVGYTIRVTAANAAPAGAVGPGNVTGPAATLPNVSPCTTPAAPVISTVVAGNAQLALTYTLGSNGGCSVGRVDYSTDSGTTWRTTGGTSGSYLITTLSADGTTALTNGVSYGIQVRAHNEMGNSPPSATTLATPYTIPCTVGDLRATAADRSVALDWTSPCNGGAPLTSYDVRYATNQAMTTNLVNVTGAVTGTPLVPGYTRNGLTAGTTYWFQVRAVNDGGSGNWGPVSPVSATPYGPASAPGTPSAAQTPGGPRAITVSWTNLTDGSSAAGYTILNGYTVTSTPGGLTCSAAQGGAAAANSCTVTGLTAATSYTFTVSAVNAAGTGTASGASNAVTAADVPSQVTALSATAGTAQVALSWTAPAANGGTITAYDVRYATDAAMTANVVTVLDATSSTAPTAAATSYTRPGLSASTTYYFQVRARNIAGAAASWGPASPVSSVPYAKPGMVTVLSATPGDTQVGLTWTAPASNGATITAYDVRYATNAAMTANPVTVSNATSSTAPTAAATAYTVTGLTNGTTYYFQVRARNAGGPADFFGPALADESATVSAVPRGVPGPVPAPTLTPGDGQIALMWTAPSANGATITSYNLRYATGSAMSNPTTITAATSGAPPATARTVTSLSNGTAYWFQAQACNAAGCGTWNPVPGAGPATPRSRPGQVATMTATASGDGAVRLDWTAPSDGGATITSYDVRYATNAAMSAGLTSVTGATTSTAPTAAAITYTRTGLTAGTTYWFQVRAVNDAGAATAWGPASGSNATVSATAATVPATMTAPTAAATSGTAGSITVSWTNTTSGTASAAAGYSAVTGYTVTASPGGATCTSSVTTSGAANSCAVTGLTAGTSYTFTLKVTNAAGLTSAASNASNAVVAQALASTGPTLTGVTPGASSLTVSWTNLANGTAAAGYGTISGYAVQYSRSDGAGGWVTASSAAQTPYAVTGLNNGVSYFVRVAAVNGVGTGPWTTTEPTAYTPDVTAIAATAVGAASANVSAASSATVGTSFTGQGSTFYLLTVTAAGSGCESISAINAYGGLTWTAVASATQGCGGTAGVTQRLYCAMQSSSTGANSLAVTFGGSFTGTAWYSLSSYTNTAAVNGNCSAGVGVTGTMNQAAAGGSTTPSVPLAAFATAKSITYSAFAAYDASSTNATVTPSGTTLHTRSYVNTCCVAATQYHAAVNQSPSVTLGKAMTTTGVGAEVRRAGYGAGPPGAPSATAVTTTTATVSWSAPSDLGGGTVSDYLVQYSTDKTDWTTFADGTSAATTATIASLVSDTVYYVRVAAVTGAGNGSWSPASGAVRTGSPPGPVASVSVTSGQDSQVPVSWTAPLTDNGNSVNAYQVDYAVVGQSYATFTTTDASTFSTVITSLTNGTTYAVRVRARSLAGWGPFTAAPTSATPYAVPGPVTVLSATPSVTSVALSWSAPANNGLTITRYSVRWSQSPDMSAPTTVADAVVATGGTAAATTYTVTSLTTATTYYFQVRATNTLGAGAWGPSPATAATPRTVPGTVTSLSATPGAGSVGLTWTAPNNGGAAITSYDILWSANSNMTGATTVTGATTGSPAATSYTVTGLTNGTTYYFQVRAANAAGPAGAWGPVTPASATPRTAPSQVTALTATAGSSKVDLSWTAPNNGGSTITAYDVRYATSADMATNLATVSSATTGSPAGTSYTRTGLTPGTTYWFQVRAANVAGSGPWGPASAVSATPFTVPGAPTLGTVTPGDGSLVVTWSAPSSNGGSSITGYRVETLAAGGGAWQVATTSGSSPFSVTGLTNGLPYSVRVAAVNAAGTGAYASSAPTTYTPAVAPITATAVSTSTSLSTVTTTSWSTPESFTLEPGPLYVLTVWTTAAPVGTVTWNGRALTRVSTAASGLMTVWRYQSASAASAAALALQSANTTSLGYAGYSLVRYDNVFNGAANNGAAAVVQANTSTTTPSGSSGTLTRILNPFRNSRSATIASGRVKPGSASSTLFSGTMTAEAGWTTLHDPGSSFVARRVAFLASPDTTPTMGWSSVVTPSSAALAVAELRHAPVTAAAPGGLAASPGVGSVALSWTTPTDDGDSAVNDYRVQYSSDGATWTTFADGTSTSLTATVSGLTNGQAYSFRVAAVNGSGVNGGLGAWSAPVSATPTTAPSRPTLVAQTGQSLTDVTVSFTQASAGGSPITDYLWSTDGTNYCPLGRTTSPLTISANSAATCPGASLGPNTARSLTIKAVNSTGESLPSNSLSVVTRAAAPTNLARDAASTTASQLGIAFTAPTGGGAGIANYEFSVNGTTWCALNPVDNLSPVVVGSTTTSACLGWSPASSTTYTVYLRAVNFGGAGVAAGPVNVTTLPAAPTLGTATPTTTQISVGYTAPGTGGTGGSAAGLTGYEYSTNGGSTWCPVVPSATTVTITNTSAAGCSTSLARPVAYTFVLRAKNAAGTGLSSAGLGVALRPEAVPILGATGTTTTSITLAWSSTGTANGYVVKVFAGDATTELSSLTLTSLASACLYGSCTYPVGSLAVGTTYYLSVASAVLNGQGTALSTSDASAKLGMTTDGSVSYGAFDGNQGFTVPIGRPYLRVKLTGGGGGTGSCWWACWWLGTGDGGGGEGGDSYVIKASPSLSPGTTYRVCVGQVGYLYAGGFNGGGSSGAVVDANGWGGGGGGAVDIRETWTNNCSDPNGPWFGMGITAGGAGGGGGTASWYGGGGGDLATGGWGGWAVCGEASPTASGGGPGIGGVGGAGGDGVYEYRICSNELSVTVKGLAAGEFAGRTGLYGGGGGGGGWGGGGAGGGGYHFWSYDHAGGGGGAGGSGAINPDGFADWTPGYSISSVASTYGAAVICWGNVTACD